MVSGKDENIFGILAWREESERRRDRGGVEVSKLRFLRRLRMADKEGSGVVQEKMTPPWIISLLY